MFSIRIHIPGGSLSGIPALDLRRKHHLRDDVSLKWDARVVEVKVDEHFARMYFWGEEVDPVVDCPVGELPPGTLVLDKRWNYIARFEISDEQAKELFIALRAVEIEV